jgi:hypothetical protein
MALTEPTPPHAVSLAYTNGLANFLKPGDPSPTVARSSQPQTQQVFALGLDDLINGGPLDKARFLGWRFLTGGRSGSALTAEVRATGPGGKPKLTGLSRGIGVTRSIHASADVRKLPQAEGHELRVLAIPGLLTEAFWLKAIPGESENDFVVPFLAAAKGLLVMHPYPAKDFLAAAQKLANQQREAAEVALRRQARKPKPQSLAAATSGD